MKDEPTYSQAIEALEAIVEEIENQDIGVDELSGKLKQAAQLIRICQDALQVTTLEVKEILQVLNQHSEGPEASGK